MAVCIDDRTTKALGESVMERLRNLSFCIVGCGGTGAGFAEMLVRSGARHLTLIDGSKVKASGLNRVTAFCQEDIDQPKVQVLKKRLQRIRTRLCVVPLQDSFRSKENLIADYKIGQCVRDSVYNSDVVFIATDSNTSRLAIENLIGERPLDKPAMYLSCGVHVDRSSGTYFFECNWSPKTPAEKRDEEGYGPKNASYIAIVQEAVAVSFSMLLSHLQCNESSFKSYSRRYSASFLPVETVVNGKSSNSTQLYQ